MVALISHKNVALPVHCHSAGVAELSGGALFVSIALLAGARQCGHQALRRDLLNTMVVIISHNDIAVSFHRHSEGRGR
eukprot:1190234-Prorocentrum_minimum.AAC.1